ncbi:MAG TPA: carotenoid biosynthesis protein [Dehalococcoidia bacterium]
MFANPYPYVESAGLLLFLLAALHAARQGRRPLLEILSAAAYGVLLEEADILLFQSYAYSDRFLLTIDRVPVVIGLVWAVILSTSMRMTDVLGLSGRAAPLADALWAVMLDLAFDAVAIRLGLWSWRIPLDAGYFGVPAGNFYAWIFVAASFSLCTRWLRARTAGRLARAWWQLAAPLPAYAGLALSLLPYLALRRWAFPGEANGYQIVAAVAALFAVVVARALLRRDRAPRRPELAAPVLRLPIHAYFLAALFSLRLHRTEPVLLAVAAGVAALELALALPSLRLLRKPAGARESSPGAPAYTQREHHHAEEA